MPLGLQCREDRARRGNTILPRSSSSSEHSMACCPHRELIHHLSQTLEQRTIRSSGSREEAREMLQTRLALLLLDRHIPPTTSCPSLLLLPPSSSLPPPPSLLLLPSSNSALWFFLHFLCSLPSLLTRLLPSPCGDRRS
eukprot:196426-Hanusia_phi.AAC.1